MESRSRSFQPPAVETLASYFPAYEIEGILAQDEAGAVYKALQRALDRPVAIKVFPQKTTENPGFRTAFEAAAKALARLEHPNLARVFEFGEIQGMPFVVMEFVQGSNLADASNGQAIDPKVAARLVLAICRGLEFAHQHGVVHGALAPSKILIDDQALPKIVGFGLDAGRGKQGPSSQEEQPGDHTAAYVAPEIAKGEGPADARADVFSAGVLLYELLTGERPPAERTPPSVTSGSPVEFDALVTKATEPNRDLRFANAGEFADELERPLAALESPPAVPANAVVLPAPKIRPPAVPNAPTTPVVIPDFSSSSPRKSRVTLTIPPILVPLALLVALGVIAFLLKDQLFQNQSSETPKALTDDGIGPIRSPGAEVLEPDWDKEPDPPRASPLESLAQLKDQLASGVRTTFPVGTLKRGDRYFLLVDEPMTWNEAVTFGEAHGAHLAVLASNEERQWFCQSFPTAAKKPVRIGGGKPGDGDWQWIDGSAWNPDDTVMAASEAHRYLTVSTSGELGSMYGSPPDVKYEFALQWREDGENPGSTEAQLSRILDEIEANGLGQARFPLGTQPYGNSRFFYLANSLPWDEAREIAQRYGGHLAAPSSSEESKWIHTTYAGELSDGKALWLGGFQLQRGEPWQWLTREAWNHSEWLADQPGEDSAHNRLLLRGTPTGPGWSASAGAIGEAAGMLIEWSPPQPAATAATFDLDRWLAGVNRKIKERVEPDLEAHQEARKKLIADYMRAVKRLERNGEYTGFGGFGRRGGNNPVIEEMVDTHLDEVKKTGEIADNLPNFAPPEFRELRDTTSKALEELDTGHERKLADHLAYYRDGLTKKADNLFATGFTDAAAQLRDTGFTVQDTAKFLTILGL